MERSSDLPETFSVEANRISVSIFKQQQPHAGLDEC